MLKIKAISIIKRLSLVVFLALAGCLGMPEKVVPIKNFTIDRYFGKWYEIARLDHSFERGLEKITATYAIRDDGGVSVINQGYSPDEQKWKVAEGKAYFVNDTNEGYLKVSFFGPFYGSYVIFELEQANYDYAFVSGPDLSYLWLLSRKPIVSTEVVEKFKLQSKKLGFDVDTLIFVNHK